MHSQSLYHLSNNHIQTPIYNHSFRKNSLLFKCICIIQSCPVYFTYNLFSDYCKAFTFYVKNYIPSFYSIGCHINNCFRCIPNMPCYFIFFASFFSCFFYLLFFLFFFLSFINTNNRFDKTIIF